MLPLLTKTAAIYLHPEYVAAVQLKGLIHKRVGYQDIINLDSDNGGEGALEALKLLLNKEEWKHCSAQIILSGSFCNFRVEKWQDNLTSEERENLLQHQFGNILRGNGSDARVFRSDNGFGKNSLAFAIDAGFYNSLQLFEKNKLFTINSVTPLYVLICNFLRKKISASAWLVIKDVDFIYFAIIKENSWEMIKVIALKHGWERDLENSLNRELILTESKANIYFYEVKESNFIFNNTNQDACQFVKLDLLTIIDPNYKLYFVEYLT